MLAVPPLGRSTVLRIRKHGGLAGAVGTQQAVDLAGLGVEADAGQGHDLAAAQVGIVLAEIANVDHRCLLLTAPSRRTVAEVMP